MPSPASIAKALTATFAGYVLGERDEQAFYQDRPGDLDQVVKEQHINYMGSGTGYVAEQGQLPGKPDDGLPDELPLDRVARYRFFRKMGQDPIAGIGLNFHVSSAISWSEDKSSAVTIDSKNHQGSTKNLYVAELRRMFETNQVHERLYSWAHMVGLMGDKFLRIYADKARGVYSVLDDESTEPENVFAFEQRGKIRGYVVPKYQPPQGEGLRLIEPWEMLHCRLPGNLFVPRDRYNVAQELNRPFTPFDISNPNPDPRIVESAYGQSILAQSYPSWIQLQRGLESVARSRWQKSKRDRIVGVGIAGASPQTAAEWVNLVAKKLRRRKEVEDSKFKAWSTQTSIDNYIIPYSVNDGGKLDFNVIDPQADITGLEDIRLHVSMFCGSIGIDPAVAGFSDQMQGGLGEGSMNRQSIIAALNSERIRRAVHELLWKLCQIHLAWKFGKVFTKDNSPFELNFHSIGTAKQREEEENRIYRLEFVERTLNLLAGLEVGDKTEAAKWAFGEVLHLDQEVLKRIIPDKAPAPGEEPGQDSEPPQGEEQ